MTVWVLPRNEHPKYTPLPTCPDETVLGTSFMFREAIGGRSKPTRMAIVTIGLKEAYPDGLTTAVTTG